MKALQKFRSMAKRDEKSATKVAKVENKKENVSRPNNPDRVGEHTLFKSTVSG